MATSWSRKATCLCPGGIACKPMKTAVSCTITSWMASWASTRCASTHTAGTATATRCRWPVQRSPTRKKTINTGQTNPRRAGGTVRCSRPIHSISKARWCHTTGRVKNLPLAADMRSTSTMITTGQVRMAAVLTIWHSTTPAARLPPLVVTQPRTPRCPKATVISTLLERT